MIFFKTLKLAKNLFYLQNFIYFMYGSISWNYTDKSSIDHQLSPPELAKFYLNN